MVVALTTNHTHFFRENHHFDHFRCDQHASAAQGTARERQPVRIWSAGCSSGEEVYTIAMCLLGPGSRLGRVLAASMPTCKLLATDLAPHVVESVKTASCLFGRRPWRRDPGKTIVQGLAACRWRGRNSR